MKNKQEKKESNNNLEELNEVESLPERGTKFLLYFPIN